MKIPESIRIAGVDYTISRVPDLNDGTRVLMGEIDYIRHEIHLNSKIEMDPQMEAITLLHEIMHGIRESTGRDQLPDEEMIVEMFARGVYQVLQDNGRKLFDIKE